MASSFKIGSVLGIPIRIHVTFLLILPVFAAIFAVNPTLFGGVEPAWLRYALGIVLAIVFFFCVLLHELGHSYVALRNGVAIKSITLIIFGGVSQMEEVPRDTRVEFVMALAGPMVSVAIGLVLLGVNWTFGYRDLSLVANGSSPLIPRAVNWLGVINLLLAGFNLIPAFPMDGGRLLRSFLANRMPYLEATSRAASLGKAFAFLLGLFGLLSIQSGGVWLILIALFIYFGAGQEEMGTRLSFTLEDLSVRDLMTRNVITASPDMTLDQVVELMLENKHTGYPVTRDGELVGIVTLGDVHGVPREQRETVTVREVMATKLLTLSPDTPAFDALRTLSSNDIGRMPVMEAGRMVGIISRTDLTRALEILGE